MTAPGPAADTAATPTPTVAPHPARAGQTDAFAHARSLAGRFADAGARAGRLHPEVVSALAAAGAFKLFLPASLGGHALSLPAACDVIAAFAEADPAAGWAVMIGTGPNWFAGFMPAALASEVFGRGSGAVAGSGHEGRARTRPSSAGDETWWVSGRWPYCSGTPWAEWFTFNARTDDGHAATIAVPAADVTVDDTTWDVRAMRATASLTTSLDDVAVPAARRFVIDEGRPSRPEPIFRVPFAVFGQVTMAAVGIGATRRLLQAFAELAHSKQPALSATVLAADPVVADAFARTRAGADAAAVALDEAVHRLWRAVDTGRPDAGTVARTQLAALHAVHVGTDAARTLRDHCGMSGLPLAATIGRIAADVETVGQNALVAPARFRELGAALLDPAGGSAPT